MGTDKKLVDYFNQVRALQDFYGPPVRSLRTPWLRGNCGFFYVDISVVCPKSQQPEGYLPLRRVQADQVLEAVADAVKALKKELR